MTSRRKFLGSREAAAMGPAFASARDTAAAQAFAAPRAQLFYKVIYDSRYSACIAFAEWMKRHGVNNGALARFHQTLKDGLEPNGILSPGRYGIRPKRLRGSPG